MGVPSILPFPIGRLPDNLNLGNDQPAFPLAGGAHLPHKIGILADRIKEGDSNQFELDVLVAPQISQDLSCTTDLADSCMGHLDGFSGIVVQSPKHPPALPNKYRLHVAPYGP